MQAEQPVTSRELPPEVLKSRPVRKRLLVAGAVTLGTLLLAILTPGSLLTKLFILASGICSQRPAHSYFFEGQQLPLEARMIGIFASFALTLVFLWFIGRGRTLRLPPRPFTIAAVALIGLVALDGLNATAYDAGLFHLYEPQLILRIVTGSLSGIGIALLVQPFFNLVIWQLAYPGGPVRSWREFSFALLIAIGVIAATMSGWGPFFWPLAFIAIGGVVAMLVMFNMMIFAMVSGRQNRARRPLDLIRPIVLTYVFTLVEMGIFAAIRISLIGSPV